uniref:Uncharacterized protein n=1 Tax=Anopheles arabiensis TaxID=7173 RepID=A0A182I9E6_ANOAR
MQWLTFRDTFECLIHDNVDLPPIQKFHYLRAALKGEAAQVIEAITISASSYELAWKTLAERYSNEYLLKKRHLQAMFGITPAKRESATTLHHFATTDRDVNKCPLCNMPHTITKCQRFNAMNPAQRYRKVLDARLCLNCLRDNHRARDCSSQYKCRHCNLAHHTMIHTESTPSTSSTTFPMLAAQDEPSHTTHATDDHTASIQRSYAAAIKQSPSQILLQTALLNVTDAHGILHPVRALLDSASQPNLMSNRLAQRLALKGSTVNITLKGAGLSTRTVRRSVRAQIASRVEHFDLDVDFLIVDKVIADLPAHDVSTRGWNIPSEFVLADPQFDKSAPIDLILGARHYASFFTNVKSHELTPNLPTMLNSVFGWVMIGPTSPQNPASPTDCTAASTIVCMASLEESLERFWKLEELSVNDSYSPDERRCETLYKETTQRDESGRYIVRLPKQTDFTEKLGLSKTTALRRFELLERRLERNPQLKEDYHAFMKEYLELGHMSLMNKDSGDERAYYLPHHPVFKASSTTTKVRVVFDGSAKTS